MKIFQFIEEYCQDLVKKAKEKASLIDLSEFPHDGFLEDITGARIPVIYVDGESVPVSDLFSMDKRDFVNTWKLPSSAQEYDNYMGLMLVLEGEDVINRIRNLVNAEKKRLSEDVELVSSI